MSAKKALLSVFLSVALLSACAGAGSDKIYVNGIDPYFPPFTFIDRNGNPSGLDVEALNWIAREMGFQIEHRPIEWNAVRSGLQSLKIDLIASGLVANNERSCYMAFTVPYLSMSQVILVRSVSHLDIDDITLGREIGTLEGAFKVEWLKEHGSRDGWNYRVRLKGEAPTSLDDQCNDQVGACEHKGAEIACPSVAREEYFAYGVDKNNVRLLTMLNKGLEKIMASHFWLELMKKYASWPSPSGAQAENSVSR